MEGAAALYQGLGQLLAVTAITPAQLASAPPTSSGGNENILQLAELGQKTVVDG